MKARTALSEAQRAAARFEKASSAHDAAKEMVTLAEEGFKEHGVVHFDQAWQEMLNHATKKVSKLAEFGKWGDSNFEFFVNTNRLIVYK